MDPVDLEVGRGSVLRPLCVGKCREVSADGKGTVRDGRCVCWFDCLGPDRREGESLGYAASHRLRRDRVGVPGDPCLREFLDWDSLNSDSPLRLCSSLWGLYSDSRLCESGRCGRLQLKNNGGLLRPLLRLRFLLDSGYLSPDPQARRKGLPKVGAARSVPRCVYGEMRSGYQFLGKYSGDDRGLSYEFSDGGHV